MHGVRVIVMAGGDVRASDVGGISNDVITFGSYDQLELKAEELLRKLCEGEITIYKYVIHIGSMH